MWRINPSYSFLSSIQKAIYPIVVDAHFCTRPELIILNSNFNKEQYSHHPMNEALQNCKMEIQLFNAFQSLFDGKKSFKLVVLVVQF